MILSVSRRSDVVAFFRKRSPYIAGFCALEALIYYLEGSRGDFSTGFLCLFAVWIYYSWLSKK